MEKILVGLDGSLNSFKALNEAIRLSKFYDAELHTISVDKASRYPETADEVQSLKTSAESKFRPCIEKAKQIAAERGCTIETHIFTGHEVKTIIDFIKDNKVDYLVVGFVGVSDVYEIMMGGTSSSLVRMAPCDVLVVK